MIDWSSLESSAVSRRSKCRCSRGLTRAIIPRLRAAGATIRLSSAGALPLPSAPAWITSPAWRMIPALTRAVKILRPDPSERIKKVLDIWNFSDIIREVFIHVIYKPDKPILRISSMQFLYNVLWITTKSAFSLKCAHWYKIFLDWKDTTQIKAHFVWKCFHFSVCDISFFWFIFC